MIYDLSERHSGLTAVPFYFAADRLWTTLDFRRESLKLTA
jgi:hypothetical protein